MYCHFFGGFIEKHVYTLIGSCVSELHAHVHVCPYRNVWLEAVYFIKNYSVYQNLTCHCNGRHGVLSVCKVSFLTQYGF